MKKLLSLVVCLMCTLCAMAETELWSSSTISSIDTWSSNSDCTAKKNADGSVSVTVGSYAGLQWGAQVKLNTTGLNYNAAKLYDFSFKATSSVNVGGITLKVDDNTGMVYETTLTIDAVSGLSYEKKDVSGVAGNGVIVFDFGYAPAGTTITLSDFSVKEHDPATPEGTEISSTDGAHKVYVTPIHYTDLTENNYVLTIRSTETISGLGGSFWNPDAEQLSSKGNSVDSHTYVVTTTKSSAPQLYTPLYVLMPGEVNFGTPTFTWEDKTSGAASDTEKPVMGTAALGKVSSTKVVVTVNATDNVGVTKYVVKNGDAVQGEYAPDNDGAITIEDLTAESAYTLNIYAKDAAGNVSDNSVQVNFTTTAAPAGQELTSGTHTIIVNAVHYTNLTTNNYVLTITSEEKINGIGGSYWNPDAEALNTKGAPVDDHTYVVTTTKTTAPQLYTPLYIMIDGTGEVNFGQPSFTWIDKVMSDETKPVMGTAELGKVSSTKVVVNVTATDDTGVAKYVVKNGDNVQGEYEPANGAITIENLTAETAYTLNIYAKDAAGNVSDNSAQVNFTTTVAPAGQELTSGTHTILVNAVHYTNLTTNNYVLTITSEEKINGIGGSYWNPDAEALNTKGAPVDDHTYVVTTTKTTAPQLYTPLYVMIDGTGEVNFGQPTFTWIDKAMADEEKPVMGEASVNKVSHNKAVINVAATDNVGVAKYAVKINGADAVDYVAANGVITVADLTAETSYTLTIFAKDDAGNVSDNSAEVNFTTTAAPEGQELTAGGHTILVTPIHYTNLCQNNYVLKITSDDDISGLGGSNWTTSFGNEELRAKGNLVDAHTYVVTTSSNEMDPQLYTPLYVMMPGEVDFGQPTFTWIDKTGELPASYTLTMSEVGYATFYDGCYAYTMPQGLEGYIFNGARLQKVYNAGDEVPADEGLVLKGAQGDYTLEYTTTDNENADNNYLSGTDEEKQIEGDADYYFYGLSLNNAGDPNSVGFYWRNQDGGAFQNAAHKAYLKLAKSEFAGAPSRFLFLQQDEVTGLDAISAEGLNEKFLLNGKLMLRHNGQIFNAAGQLIK